MKTGTVFNIQRMSIHDGPGIRTTVFLKGCPLRCIWCSNPESQRMGKEIACFEARCVSCGYCSQVCPKGLVEDKPPFEITDRDKCDLCGICVKECCTGAKDVIGDDHTSEELFQEIMKDKSFYDSAGGGVTFSGGEPLMQHDFLKETLEKCKEEGLHTAIETSGMTETEKIKDIAGLLDLMFYDMKHMDDEIHREVTGVSNSQILKNLAELAKVHDNIIVRIPVIPGINDSEENVAQTASYISALGIKCLELLPYHNLGECKYGQLGREYTLSDVKTPDKDYMEKLAAAARNAAGEHPLEVSIMKSL